MADRIADITSLDLERRKRAGVDARSGTPEPIVAQWRCREPMCATSVGVTRSAIEAADMFDRVLRARREKLIDRDRTMLCAEHAAAWHEREQRKARGLL